MPESADQWQRLKDIFNEVGELAPAERQKYLSKLRLDEKTLFGEISELLEAEINSADFLRQPLVFNSEHSFIGETVGHYRIVREIGRGGMGAVFEALREDGEFEQKAAVKLTNRNLFSDELIKRFRRERQILASLEHANIVRLLDGGITANHIPYFVMEFVEGKNITDFCRENLLGINERLKLFLQICEAVSYAHRQLIIHRDLKPSNILVTPDKQVKLLDFGIAKILDSEEQTLTANAPLTPDYAAPEQVKGEIITTSTDIYSLGVILFELLTESSPCEIYGVERTNLLHGVCESEPVRPSSVVIRSQQTAQKITAENREQKTNPKSLRGDLDNITLKCLQKNKNDRYASVEQLADDIKSFLNGLPVKAHPPSFFYRTGKFISRNRLSVFSAAILVLMILTAAFIAVWQSIAARHQRQIAEHNFNQVRKLANLLILDYHDEIAKLEGSTKLREKLVNDALNYLDAISPEETENAELLKEMAIAYRKIGDVQGKPYAANLGQTTESIKNHEKSVELLEKAEKLNNTDISIKDELALSYNSLLEYRGRQGNPPKDLLTKIINLNQKIIELDPDNLQRKISWIKMRMSLVSKKALDHDDVLTEYLEVLEDARELFINNSQNVELISVLRITTESIGSAYKWYGIDIKNSGDLARSKILFQQGYDYAKQSLDFMSLQNSLDPLNGKNNRRFYAAFANLSTLALCLEQTDKAENYLKSAETEFTKMKKGDPNNKENILDELLILRNKSFILQSRNKTNEAIRIIRHCIQTTKEAKNQDNNNGEIDYWLATFYQEMITVSNNNKDKQALNKFTQQLNQLKSEYQIKYKNELVISRFGY